MKTIGLARLGRDAETRYTPGGDAVCNLSLAFNYGKKGDDGNRPSQWIDASIWGDRATALAPYLLKGSVHCFHIEGVHIEHFTKSDGTQGVKMAGMVQDIELGPRQDSGQGAAPAPACQAAPAAGAPRAAPKPAPNFSDKDDDIPF